jgi:hypothetical protein
VCVCVRARARARASLSVLCMCTQTPRQSRYCRAKIGHSKIIIKKVSQCVQCVANMLLYVYTNTSTIQILPSPIFLLRHTLCMHTVTQRFFKVSALVFKVRALVFKASALCTFLFYFYFLFYFSLRDTPY